MSPSIGAYVFLGTGVLSFLVLFLYGFAGVVILPFSDSVLRGILCWICPFYFLGYLFREWDRMKGCFLSYVVSFGVVIFMAIALPGLNAARHDLPKVPGGQPAAAAANFANVAQAGFGQPAEFPGPAGSPFGRAQGFGPPPGRPAADHVEFHHSGRIGDQQPAGR